ncbi:hypothetical protein COCNU_contig69401837G000010 [Cocos nucifera]|nr:hypothetical protein [Cocos nucifera]
MDRHVGGLVRVPLRGKRKIGFAAGGHGCFLIPPSSPKQALVGGCEHERS